MYRFLALLPGTPSYTFDILSYYQGTKHLNNKEEPGYLIKSDSKSPF